MDLDIYLANVIALFLALVAVIVMMLPPVVLLYLSIRNDYVRMWKFTLILASITTIGFTIVGLSV